MNTIINIAIWYGVLCAAFNGLTVLASAIVRRTPGESDDKAIDAFYQTGFYKAIAWVFSWGDYAAEFLTKIKPDSE